MRQLRLRARTHTIINIGGLAVGLCAGLLIALIHGAYACDARSGRAGD